MAFIKKFSLVVVLVLIAGCAGGSLKPTVTANSDARKTCPVAEGTVIQIIDVIIEGNIEVVQGVGAGVGGYAGHEAAGDNEIAQVLGAVVGAAAGDIAGRTAFNNHGQELIVVIGTTTYSIIQETDNRATFIVGDDV